MQHKLQGTENTRVVSDRRTCPRVRVNSLIYIDIGDVNGGIVTSLSEKGLALTAADALRNGELGTGPLQMRILFPGAPEAVEASGVIVWTSASGREACARFVNVGAQAREQIRGWVSDHISRNALRPELPNLPKMQLPSTRRAKPRGPRFSFADVASSRLDAEAQTASGDFPGSAAELGELPPLERLEPGAVGFRDGTEAVASAFESSAFTEEQTRKMRGAGNEQTDQARSGQDFQKQPTLSQPERRQHSRRQILLFTYAVLGEDNGGLVFNLGEGGLALTAASALRDRHFAKMRVRFPDSEDWFDTSGRLAWAADSGKEAGIEFVSLPEQALARIKEWVSQKESDDARTSQSGVQELPDVMDPGLSSTEPLEIPASFEEEPFEGSAVRDRFEEPFEEHGFAGPERTPAASSGLFETGTDGIFAGASQRRHVPEFEPALAADDSVRLAASVTRKALGIAAGAALAVASWMFVERHFFNETSRLAAANAPSIQTSPQEPAQKPDVVGTQAGADRPTADPPVQQLEQPVQQNENATMKTGVAQPSAKQIESELLPSSTSKAAAEGSNSVPDRALKGQLRSEEVQAQLGASSSPASSSPPPSAHQSERPAPSQHEPETKSSNFTASVAARTPQNASSDNKPDNKPNGARFAASKAAESRPVLTARANLNAAPASVNASAPQLGGAPPVEVEKENLLVAMKQPEAPLVRTPVVTVSFDPYPSIRIPKAEKSKKSRQGESLQMGRLLTRVDPVYPEAAKRQGVEGTVKVHAIFDRGGNVQSVIPVSGPQVLLAAALSAVRQWRYSQTILGGQAMETEEDITVLFQLENSASKN